MAELREQGVGTQVLYIPVYLQPWYQETYGYGFGKFSNAEAYYLKSLSLPLYPTMTDDDVERVIGAVQRIANPPSCTTAWRVANDRSERVYPAILW